MFYNEHQKTSHFIIHFAETIMITLNIRVKPSSAHFMKMSLVTFKNFPQLHDMFMDTSVSEYVK